MVKQAYITLMGRSPWAVVNSFHALVIETDFRPDRIVFIYESQYSKVIEPVIKGLETIQQTFTKPRIEGIEVPDWDMHAAGEQTRLVVKKLEEDGAEVALNITAGRKALVAGTLLGLLGRRLDYLYYLTIETTGDAAKPYLMIPKRIQQLRELKKNAVCTRDIVLDPGTGWVGMELAREYLMVVLNHAYKEHVRIVVKAPLLDSDIIELDPFERKVHMLTDRARYDASLRACRDIDWDHPTCSQLRESLCFSGILEYRTGNQFREFLLESYRRHRDPRSSLGKWYLSLDSNLFYGGVVSCLDLFERTNQIRRGELLYVTSDGVVQEIDRKVARKYPAEYLRAAKAGCQSGKTRLLDEFHNRNTLETRIAKMASSELSKLMKWPTHERAECGELPIDHEAADRVIVKSVSEFAARKGATVTFLSAEPNMENHCRSAGNLGCFVLEPPNEIPHTLEITDQGFIDLLVALSVLYGVVKLDRIGYLFGDYGGKGSVDYMSTVKVVFDNLHRAKLVEEHINTCRKLIELGISE